MNRDLADKTLHKIGEEMEQKNYVASVLKACNLLECFSHTHQEMTLGELAEQTNLNKATARRILATLELAGWVERTLERKYRLAFRLFEIGSIVASGSDLKTQAWPVMTNLANRLGDTAYLFTVAGTKAICIERIEGPAPLQVRSFGPGHSLPLYVGASPLAILAFSSDELFQQVAANELVPYTDNGITTLEALKERINVIHKQGYCFSEEDVMHGVCAVGAPVFDRSGSVVGAISIGGPCARFQSENLQSIISTVKDAAHTLSLRMGYTN